MEKKYGLKIEDDVIYLTSVRLNETTLEPYDETQALLLNMLLNTDTIINVTDLDILPIKGATWDGVSFSESRSLLDPAVNQNYKELYRFVYLQNNIVIGWSSYNKNDERAPMMVAALSSNPQIIEMQ
jgi:hypothetical protein